MKKSLFLSLFLLLSVSLSEARLKPFTSDGCSSSPDGLTLNREFLQCCIQHDLLYWQGGTYEEKIAADKDFKACLDKETIPMVSWVYHTAVGVGGARELNAPWSWGYGWEPLRLYRTLSNSERKEVEKMSPDLSILLPLIHTYSYISQDITQYRILKELKDKYGFVPSTAGWVYLFVQIDDQKVDYSTEPTGSKDYLLLTHNSCPQGYYLVGPTDIYDHQNPEIKALGTCPELKSRK